MMRSAPLLAALLLVACTAADGVDTPDRGTGRNDTTGEPDASDASDAVESADTAGDTEPADTAVSDTTADTSVADTTPDDADAAPDTFDADTATADTTATDTAPDTAPDTTIDPACDRDNDGFAALSCGGDDCNDNLARVRPDGSEGCDFTDNNCDGANNEGLDCTFYAHTPSELYRIDPFAGTSTLVTSTPTLWDFDTDTDGTLWGIGPDGLYRFDSGAWSTISGLSGVTGSSPNGFAIDSTGRAYATGGGQVYLVNLDTGTFSLIGNLGGFTSSGDCVVDKSDTVYMSASGFGEDDLVRINGSTGAATLIGSIGFPSVYGLTAAWGFLFGLDASGNVIEINPTTGRGNIVQNFSNRVWYGAASSAGR